MENVRLVCRDRFKHERLLEEFLTVMSNRDEVKGLLNCREFSQPLG